MMIHKYIRRETNKKLIYCGFSISLFCLRVKQWFIGNAIFLNYELLINEIIEYQMFDSIEKASICMAFLRCWLTDKRLFCTTIAKTTPRQILKECTFRGLLQKFCCCCYCFSSSSSFLFCVYFIGGDKKWCWTHYK